MTPEEIRTAAALQNLEDGRITVRVGEVFQFDGPVLDYRLLVTASKVVRDLLKWKDPKPLVELPQGSLDDSH